MKIADARFAALAVLLLGSVACGGGAATPRDQPDATPAATGTSPEPAGEGTVAYEPAYPEEVSTEELSAADVDQQEAGHAHGEGAGHDHDPDDHGHDH
jgi:hypothetical protein